MNRSQLKAIGGSQIGAIVGLNDFMTPLDVYYTIVEGATVPENKYMKAGIKLEPAVAEYFQEETGREVTFPAEVRKYHSQYPFLVASVDRIWKENDRVGILECKTTQRDWGEDDIPESYIAQLLWYLGIYGYKIGSLAWLIRGLDFRYNDVDFNEIIYNQLITQAVDFWQNHIEKKIPPEPTTGDDVRRYIRNHITGKAIVAVPETYERIMKLKELKSKKKEIDTEMEILTNSILPVVSDAEAVQDLDGNILLTYKKSKDSVKLDSKRLEKEQPEIYNNYLIAVEGSRRLLIK